MYANVLIFSTHADISGNIKSKRADKNKGVNNGNHP